MKLSIPFFQSKKDTTLYYLALLLTPEKVSAVVLEEIEGKIKILSRQSQTFTTTIEDITQEELIETVDHALSRALEVLPPNIEIRKTVFGVKENWVEEDSKKIKRDYLRKLKKLCDSLDLSPIGFMVVSEAISNLLQQDDGVPLSAILVDLGKKIATLTLFRGGKIIQTVEGEVDGSRILTVNSLLNRFTVEVLPARIILYDTEIDESLVQQFIRHQWSKTLPFLHMPQISVLPEDFESRAVAFGAAVQMGFEIINDDVKNVKNYELGTETQGNIGTDTENEVIDDSEDSFAGNNFGFTKGEDIAEVGTYHTQESNEKEQVDGIESDELPGTDIDDLAVKQDIRTDDSLRGDILADEEDEDMPDEVPGKRWRGFSFNGLLKKPALPSLRFPTIARPGIVGIIVPILFVVLLAGGGYYYYTNQVSASVILNLTPKEVTKTSDVTFAADSDNDFSSNILSGSPIEGTLDGEMTLPATGKKEVGDKAKGVVTIYNSDLDSGATLSKGTIIKSSSGLGFVLDKDVTVASASGNRFTGTKPGTAKVDVSADELGTKHNLPSGTEFSVGGNSQLAARNEGAFSGGTSKTVTVVSKSDLENLRTDLLDSLEKKAQDELLKLKPEKGKVLPIVLSTSAESTKFDKNEGDEAKSVKLTATLSYTGLSYEDNDLINFAKQLLEEEHGNDMTISSENLDINIQNAEKNEDVENEVKTQIYIKASLLPKIKTPELAKQLSGKSREEAENMLSDLPQVEDTVIQYRPNISFLAKLFPRLPTHVTITLSSD